jgi:hypothetical protein
MPAIITVILILTSRTLNGFDDHPRYGRVFCKMVVATDSGQKKKEFIEKRSASKSVGDLCCFLDNIRIL